MSEYDDRLNYISSACFLPNNYSLVSRDFLNFRMWDLRKGSPTFSAEVSDVMSRNLDTL